MEYTQLTAHELELLALVWGDLGGGIPVYID